jgi:hypothetical protein
MKPLDEIPFVVAVQKRKKNKLRLLYYYENFDDGKR